MGTNSKEEKEPIQRGAGKADSAWFAEIMAAGEMHPVDEHRRPPGMLWEINYQWDGHADEVNIEFFDFFRRRGRVDGPEPRKCNGTSYIRDMAGMYIVDCEWNRLTRPCLGLPIRGGTVCQTHGGRIGAVKEAAARALAAASEVVALRLIGLTDVEDEQQVRIEPSDRIKAANSVLDRAGVKGTVELEVKLPGYQKVLSKMFEDDSAEEDPNG